MKKISYSEKLRDKRWQKRRLQIFERDNWICQCCLYDDPESRETLHVHHRYYLKNTEPWDYPDDALITACESCHTEVSSYVSIFDQTVKGFIHPIDLILVADSFFQLKQAGLCSRSIVALLQDVAAKLRHEGSV